MSLPQILIGYFFFTLLFALFHGGIVSLFAFLHFLLGHSFSTIDDWILTYSLFIIFLSKSSAFFFCLRFYQGRYDHQFKWKELITSWPHPRRVFFSLLVALWITFVIIFIPLMHFNDQAKWDTLSELGKILANTQMMFWDLLWISLITEHLKEKKISLIYRFFLALIFIVMHNFCVTYSLNRTLLNFVPFWGLLEILFSRKKNLIEVIVFLFLFVTPVAVLFGLNNLLLNEQFALFVFQEKSSMKLFLFLWIGIIIYNQIALREKRGSNYGQ